jgi:hypothetical protein
MSNASVHLTIRNLVQEPAPGGTAVPVTCLFIDGSRISRKSEYGDLAGKIHASPYCCANTLIGESSKRYQRP